MVLSVSKLRLCSFALVLSLLLSCVTGCGKDKKRNFVMRTFSTLGSETDAAPYSQIIAEYTKTHKNVVINDTSTSRSGSYKMELSLPSTYRGAGTPDVIYYSAVSDMSELADFFMTVDDIRKDYPKFASNVSEAALNSAAASNGGRYCIPVRGEWRGIVINATVEAVKKLDVCVPWTTLSLDEALDWQKRNGRALIVKPRWGQGSIGLFKVSTPSELTWAFNLSAVTAARFAAACPEINAKEPQVIVQECIGGVEYGCDIVNDLEGRYRSSFVKRKFGMRAGETDAAESVEHPAVVAVAEKIGRWSGHLGCMDSDWIVGDDGVPRLIELNPRFGGGYPFTHAAGANIVRACVDWVNGIDDYAWCAGFRTGVKAFKEIGIHVCDAADNPQA